MMLHSLLHYIKKSPDCFHAISSLAQMLEEAGYVCLPEGSWELEAGGTYYVRANESLQMEKFSVRPLAERKVAEAKKDCKILH